MIQEKQIRVEVKRACEHAGGTTIPDYGSIHWRFTSSLRGYTLTIIRSLKPSEGWCWQIQPDGFAFLHIGKFTDLAGLLQAIATMRTLIEDLPNLEPQWEAARKVSEVTP